VCLAGLPALAELAGGLTRCVRASELHGQLGVSAHG
jgi:hypothetical protein